MCNVRVFLTYIRRIYLNEEPPRPKESHNDTYNEMTQGRAIDYNNPWFILLALRTFSLPFWHTGGCSYLWPRRNNIVEQWCLPFPAQWNKCASLAAIGFLHYWLSTYYVPVLPFVRSRLVNSRMAKIVITIWNDVHNVDFAEMVLLEKTFRRRYGSWNPRKHASHPSHFACVGHPPTHLRLRYVLVEMITSGGRIPLLRHHSSGRYPERVWWTSPRNFFRVPIPMNPPQSSEENGCRSWLLIPPRRTYEDGWACGRSRYPLMHEKDYVNNGMRQKSKI